MKLVLAEHLKKTRFFSLVGFPLEKSVSHTCE
jgi:hypothetical protein